MSAIFHHQMSGIIGIIKTHILTHLPSQLPAPPNQAEEHPQHHVQGKIAGSLLPTHHDPLDGLREALECEGLSVGGTRRLQKPILRNKIAWMGSTFEQE